MADARHRLLSVVENLDAHMRHLKEEGGREVSVQPETLEALSRALDAEGSSAERAVRAPSSAPQAAPAPVQHKEPIAMSQTLKSIADRVAACRLCGLCTTRTNTVPGQGSESPEIMFVGEGPGADEDAQGLAFVGRAGKLLTQMIEAMGYQRDEVWIGNIVKCRPPNNRKPTQEEMQACLPYLKEQIAFLKPKVIVCLGATAVQGLLNDMTGITKLRGEWRSFEGIDTMPTFHPAYLLRNPPAKREVWTDLKTVLERLGRPVPEKKR